MRTKRDANTVKDIIDNESANARGISAIPSPI